MIFFPNKLQPNPKTLQSKLQFPGWKQFIQSTDLFNYIHSNQLVSLCPFHNLNFNLKLSSSKKKSTKKRNEKNEQATGKKLILKTAKSWISWILINDLKFRVDHNPIHVYRSLLINFLWIFFVIYFAAKAIGRNDFCVKHFIQSSSLYCVYCHCVLYIFWHFCVTQLYAGFTTIFIHCCRLFLPFSCFLLFSCLDFLLAKRDWWLFVSLWYNLSLFIISGD